MMKELTKKQQQILNFISEHLSENGYPPTRAEIATNFGFNSNNAADEYVKALAKKGAISIMPGISRGIKIINQVA